MSGVWGLSSEGLVSSGEQHHQTCQRPNTDKSGRSGHCGRRGLLPERRADAEDKEQHPGNAAHTQASKKLAPLPSACSGAGLVLSAVSLFTTPHRDVTRSQMRGDGSESLRNLPKATQLFGDRDN